MVEAGDADETALEAGEADGCWIVTCVIATGFFAALVGGPLLGIAAILSTTSIPETTSPKIA